MSKERELLRKISRKTHCINYDEIEQLLAQPEPFKPDWANYRQGVEDEINQAKNTQPEQEPVAWMWTRNYEGGGYTNMVFQMKCEADEYAKDSESLKRPDLVRPLYLGVDQDE